MINLSKANEIDQAWLLVKSAGKVLRGESTEHDFDTLNNFWRLLQVYETARDFTIPHYTGDMHKVFDDIHSVRERYCPKLTPSQFVWVVREGLNSFLIYRFHKPEYKFIVPMVTDLEACWKREAANE